MLSQESSLDPSLTVDFVMEGACLHAQDLIARHDQLLEEISSADDDNAHSLHSDYEHLTHEMT